MPAVLVRFRTGLVNVIFSKWDRLVVGERDLGLMHFFGGEVQHELVSPVLPVGTTRATPSIIGSSERRAVCGAREGVEDT